MGEVCFFFNWGEETHAASTQGGGQKAEGTWEAEAPDTYFFSFCLSVCLVREKDRVFAVLQRSRVGSAAPFLTVPYPGQTAALVLKMLCLSMCVRCL